MTTTLNTSDPAITDLARRLFVAGGRLGWRYVPPEPAMGYAGRQPQMLPPPLPDLRALETQAANARRRLKWAVPVGGILTLTGLPGLASGGGFVVLVGLALLAFAFVPMITADNKISEAKRAAAAVHANQTYAFREAQEHHRAAAAAHQKAEQERVAAAMVWYPMTVESAQRLDVIGGDRGARSALLATLGCSLLASGNTMSVLDLTDEGISSALATLAAAVRTPVRSVDLPADLAGVDLLADLEAGEAAELLAAAIHPRTQDDTRDVRNDRDLAADLIRAVLIRLEARPSLARLVGGLRVLRSVYDATTDDALTQGEFTRLTAATPDLVSGERSRDALHLLDIRLSLLVTTGAGTALDALGAPGLTVVTTDVAGNDRRRDLLDQVLGALVLRAVQGARGAGTDATVVIAGADRLGATLLESLASAAFRSSVRLLLLFDHLRGEVLPLVGGPNSTAVVMRMGNHTEAAAAADFIGREHQFVLGQVSRQQSRTVTDGGGTSVTEGTSHTYTQGVNRGAHGGGSSESVAQGRSESYGTNQTWSISDAYTDGQVDTRAYEYTVEPTVIQSLEPTTFVLVDAPGGRRTAVMGNCDPRITQLDRVSETPAEAR